MPEPKPSPEEPLRPIRPELLRYIKNVEKSIPFPTENIPLAQYWDLNKKVFQLVQAPKFLDAMDEEWKKLRTKEGSGVVLDAMLEELNAFSNAVDGGEAAEKENPDALPKGWRSTMLGWASTTVGSLKDLLKEAPWYVKSVLTLFKELIDIFKGKE
jgi:hypothetical protein